MRRYFVLPAVILALSFTGGSAHADHDWVEVGYEIVPVALDDGFVITVLCNASAVTSVTTDVPLATVVSCSINGRSANRATPGRESYVAVDDLVVGPYTVCISGQAAFYDPVTHGISVPSKGEVCTTHVP